MSRSSARRLAVLTLAGGCLAAAAVPALADPTPVTPSSETVVSTAATGAGTRQLQVLKLDGNALDNLTLTPGVPSPFRVKVQDTGVGQLGDAAGLPNGNADFQVQAVMNNLYLAGNGDAASFIPAEDIDVAFGAGSMTALGDVTALAEGTLSGTLTCTSITSALNIGNLAAFILDPATALLGSLVQDVCDALPTGGLDAAGIPLSSSLTETVKGLTDLPIALGAQSDFSFTPDYNTGIGAADNVRVASRTDGKADGFTPNPRLLLTGTPSATAGLTGLSTLATQMTALPLVAATGDSTATLNDVIGALSLAGNGALATALTNLAAEDLGSAVTTVALLNGVISSVGLDDITGVTAQYNSLPIMTVTPTNPIPDGTYTGTMTVTLVQP